VIIEPGVGGRIYERTPQGEEHDWDQRGWAGLLPRFRVAIG
jgi:hypothetical protein